MKLFYLSNFNKVAHQTKILFFILKIMILILSIILKFGQSKDKTFFYLNKPSWPFKVEYLPSWP